MIATVRRGPVLMVSGLVLSAVYTVGLHAAIPYAVDATIQHQMEMNVSFGADLTMHPGGLAEDLAGIRSTVRRLTFPVGAVTLCLSFVALLLPWLRGRIRFGVLVLSGVLWVMYPLTVLETLGAWGSYMVGDGGATGVPHRFAGWLPLGALLLFVAATLQAIGLVLLARRGTTDSAYPPCSPPGAALPPSP
ncbi:hypothetical protein [Nonomuraea recticatena]|uniref:DUF1461 domain-containing protein n=1 Tax=Nonomuraea recticatena TaxID=46178 RepID=A0ABN3SSI9_9ACTN